MSGYSGTPLARKLGVKPSSHIVALRAPEGHAALLDPLPDGVAFGRSVGPRSDVVHVFFRRRLELERDLVALPLGLVDLKVCAIDECIAAADPKARAKQAARPRRRS